MKDLKKHPETIAILSNITNKKIDPAIFSPSIFFLASLIPILLGTIYADGTITSEEKQQFQKVIDRLTPAGIDEFQWVQLLITGTQKQQIHTSIEKLFLLTQPLSDGEKMFCVALAYQVASCEGTVGDREKSYLTAISKKIGIHTEHLAVIESGFGRNTSPDSRAILNVRSLLKLEDFKHLEPIFCDEVRKILQKLPHQKESDTNDTKFYSKTLQKSANKVTELLQLCLSELTKAKEKLQTQTDGSKISQEQIWLKIGECSGCYSQLNNIVNEDKKRLKSETIQNWNEYISALKESVQWKYLRSLPIQENEIEDKTKITEEYANHATKTIKNEIEVWIDKILQDRLKTVKKCLKIISQNIEFIHDQSNQTLAKSLIIELEKVNSKQNFSEHISKELSNTEDSFNVFELASDFTDSVLGSMSGFVGKFGIGGHLLPQQTSISQKVFDKVWEKFNQSQEKLIEKISDVIEMAIIQRVQSVSELAHKTILLYENFLEIQEQFQQRTPEQREQEMLWIEQKNKHIDELQTQIRVVLD